MLQIELKLKSPSVVDDKYYLTLVNVLIMIFMGIEQRLMLKVYNSNSINNQQFAQIWNIPKEICSSLGDISNGMEVGPTVDQQARSLLQVMSLVSGLWGH